VAFELHTGLAFPGLAASNVQPGQVVSLASGTERGIHPCASANLRPFGVAFAVATAADAVTVHPAGNIVKCIAHASVGVGAEVTVASGSATGVAPVAGASGVERWSVGQSVTAAAAGETLSVYVHPRQLGLLA